MTRSHLSWGLVPLALALPVAVQVHDHSQHSRDAGKPAHAAPAPKPRKPANEPGATPERVLEGYRPFRDLPPLAWKDANERVRDVGGHAGAMKEGAW